VTGETRSWKQTTDNRHFCATCGSSVFGLVDGADEVEVGVGAFDDAPTDLKPAYELDADANGGSIRLTAQSSMWAIGPEEQPPLWASLKLPATN
jgi:hypothetical protein